MSAGPMAERVVTFFLESGKAPEQGYKACASLMKLGERYSKKRLEMACMRILAYGTTPSNRYGITRGAAYFKKGGDHE